MERKARISMGAALLVVGIGTAMAQITIQRSDIEPMYAAGGPRVVYHYDTLTHTVDIGRLNVPNVWDFSGLSSNKTSVLRGVAASGSLYAGEFPAATHVLLDTAFVFWLNADALLPGVGWAPVYSSEAYFYYGFGDSLQLYGVGATAIGYLSGTPVPIDKPRWRNAPPAVEMQFPLQLSKSWTCNFADSVTGTATLPILGSLPFALRNTDSVTYTVDAYGMLTIPGGHTQPALRIRKAGKYSYSDTLHNFHLPLQYLFLTANGATMEAGMVDSTITEGAGQVRYMKWTIPLPTDVREVADVPTKFGLDQNYPNPFNPSTTIRYRVQGTGYSEVRLSVFDILGQEVARLVDGPASAGEQTVVFNARGLASGTYHYRLTVSDGKQTLVETKSMMLLR
jgi:hypothetical protein